MEVIKNSKETFVRLQQLIWNGGTDTHTDTQTDPCIELRYSQLIIYKVVFNNDNDKNILD